VDIAADNLLNPVDGAYMRLSKAKSAGNEKYVFCQWDLTQAIEAYVHKIEDPGLKAITEAVFGLVGKTAIKRDLARFYNMGNDPFDVVSCQFAIHYVCESEDTLDHFAGIVASKLADGGHFVGTCMDGVAVHKAVQTAGGSMSSTKNDKLMWMITEKYGKVYKEFGSVVDVYVESINRVMPEFLVDFDSLVTVFGRHGLKLETSGMFDEAFEECLKADSGTIDLDLIGEEEKEFSFLNRYFVFLKT
jgi:SAM-dependent methyltransferase